MIREWLHRYFTRKWARNVSVESLLPDENYDTETSTELSDPYDGLAVAVPIEDFIDLHTYNPSETEVLLREYLWEAVNAGYSEVRIIHGKGEGVQRRIVRAFLERHPSVVEFHDAPPELGGWGATIAQLDIGGRKEK